MGWIERLVEAFVRWVTRCLPKYDPAAWNDADGIQYHNNCYNYACDIRTDTRAQPGRAHGILISQEELGDCRKVTAGATADGLVSVECDDGCGCSNCWHQVALVLYPRVDYHWYRRDRDGRWSHKPGTTPATNLDNSGNIIEDPRTADRGPYTVFCGCFCVNKDKVKIS